MRFIEMKDIENNSNAIFTDITVLESSNLNVITSNAVSLFGTSGQVRITAAPSTVDYNLVLPNSIGTSGQLLATDGLGSAYWVTAGGGGGGTGTVTSVGVTVPSIFNVSGSPIVNSGTIAITTATTPTGSGAIVLRTQPSISNPTITGVSNGTEIIGINALDSTVPDDLEYVHLFGRDTLDAKNYLRLSTSSDTSFKSGSLRVDSLILDFNHQLGANLREITLLIASDSKIVLGRNDTTEISTIELISDVIRLPSVFSNTTRPSILTTTRVSGQSNVQSISAGTTGQILTVQGDGSLNFSAPATSGGTVTSVGLAVPSIFTITGTPVTTSGTLTIGLTNPATGSGGIVLRTNPIMTRPTIGSSGGIGIIALANTTVGAFNTHQFGCASTEALLFLEIGTLSTTIANTDRFSYLKCGESQVTLGQNSTVGNYIRLNKTATADVTILLPQYLSSASATSLLSTTRNGSDSQTSSIPAGTIGQVLTVQSGGGLAFTTPGTGGTVTSVGVSVPSILSVSGSPITTSGTIAITTATTPTGSGAIVLRTQPSISNPTITSISNVGVRALDSTIPLNEFNNHYFGTDLSNPLNYLKISTLSSDNSIDDRYSTISHGASIIRLGNNDTAITDYISLEASEIRVPAALSTDLKNSIITSGRSIYGYSVLDKIEASSTAGTVLTSDGAALSFETPGYTTQTVTSKVKNTIYRNTTLKPLFVSMVINPGINNETFTVKCDASSTPVTIISFGSYFTNMYSLSFIVLPNYYYQLTSSGIGTVNYWVEWN